MLAPRNDVPDVLAAFDLFIHPALAESFGFAVVEAMAMERPVVATSVGIARDVIEDGVSGFTISGTDPDSIRAAIATALAQRDRWPQLGAEARKRRSGSRPSAGSRVTNGFTRAGFTTGVARPPQPPLRDMRQPG